MSFDVAAESYQRFMGRFADPLATAFVELLQPSPGQRALDVGAGTGALTAPLVTALGADAVAAVDPSEPFVEALRHRLPTVEVRIAAAEQLPFPDDGFDLAAAQLVVHFMTDPVAGIREMARVTVPGGVVAASVWDFAGGRAPLSLFWKAARQLDPGVADESERVGARSGDLGRVFHDAGLAGVHETTLEISVAYRSFDDWWEPYTLGVGPAGAYVAALDPDRRNALRDRSRALLPPGPGTTDAVAWVALGTA